MKNFLKVFILAAGLVLCFNAKSFALVDVAAYGGYVFNGETGKSPIKLDWTGPQCGLKAHYNTSLVPLVELGVGAYCQYLKMKYDDLKFGGTTYPMPSIPRTSFGLDVNVIFSTLVINPYIRLTYALYDKFDYDRVGDYGTENFKQYGVGIGAEFPVAIIKLFG